MKTAGHPYEKFEDSESLIISLALSEMPDSAFSNCPAEIGVRLCAQIIEVGVLSPP